MKIRSIMTGLVASIAIMFTSNTPLKAESEFTMNFGTVAPTGTPWSSQLEQIKKTMSKWWNFQITQNG